ncbi:MAG: LysM peptidoglycan-binding domain-containing protein, partial [Myxococcota bacterium]
MPQVNRPSSTTIPQAAGSTNSYTVRSGDTLAAIASRHGTTAAALVEANKARYPSLESNPGAIQVGWSLSLPTGSPKATSPAAANQGWRPRSNNDVLMVGMNEGVQYEATELRKRGVNVDVITDARENDKVSVNGRTYDL